VRLAGEQSLLVGFKSDVKHEVTPVTSGERFTLVTWFF
jgi:predicted 2-oxoglutarate/Fe(II)-dependent dioxygenase YbiX